MASLVFTAFTFEAYLNWLGTQIFRHWSYLERLNPKEELQLIADHLEVKIDNGKRPWQTIKPLFGFRNDIAHGKPKTIATETTEPNDDRLYGKLGETARTDWELYCSLENAERARADVEEILEAPHAAAITASYLKDGLGPLQHGLHMHSAVLKAADGS